MKTLWIKGRGDEMLELMNMAILEVNARRRVERIAEDMRDARRVTAEIPAVEAPSAGRPRPMRVPAPRESLSEA
jgi:hypothetical protein